MAFRDEKQSEQSDRVSATGNLLWCVVPGGGCRGPDVQKTGSNRESHTGRFAWGCLLGLALHGIHREGNVRFN